MTDSPAPAATRPRSPGLLNRQLDAYPDNRRRAVYLGITVLATVILYYELYIPGAVATKIIADLGFSFTQFVLILVIGNAVGAFASLAAGLADRWGRANLVVIGLFVTGVLLAFVIPNSSGRLMYGIGFALLSLVEGVVLVATPALIRDFSPQLGRGVAMGFWTLGPVLGSLVVTEVSSNTLDSHPDWQFQLYVCGAVGLVVAVIAAVGLRELSPALRDQLMVSLDDRALVEARARDLDPDEALRGHWRQMLRPDIVGPAFAVAVFLLLYYMLVVFAVIYFVTVFGYSEARANSLLNWYWITNAIALVVAGLLSDRLRVRKPFMVLGALISLVGAALFATAATDESVGYHTLAFYLVLAAAGAGLAYVAWMAAFTETVEKHNPAATATGLAVWGWILRAVVTAGFAVLIAALPAAGVLVDKGQRAQAIAARYPAQIATLQKLSPATSQALSAKPDDASVQAKAIAEVAGNGVTASEVTRVLEIRATKGDELATLQAISPANLLVLAQNPTDAKALAGATADVAKKFKISTTQAQLRLLKASAGISADDRQLLITKGLTIQAAGTELLAVNRIPANDQKYLAANAETVQQAQADNPGQWQNWWWVCFAGQIVFVPFIFLLSGRWSPARAREDEKAHRARVAQELESLSAGR